MFRRWFGKRRGDASEEASLAESTSDADATLIDPAPAEDATLVDPTNDPADADATLIDPTGGASDPDATVVDATGVDEDATPVDATLADDDATLVDATAADATQTVSDDDRTAPMAAPPPEHPDHIGHFRILKTLGEGGMGAVYLAEQSEPIERKVALKVVHASLRSRDALLRFEAERQAMARLAHPNIAALFEAGATPDGFPYFAMEAVPGDELMPFCDGKRMRLRERLELFVDICAGVTHAHQKGLLHRDLKPGNILVTEIEGKPVPKIIDFGIAKAVDDPLVESDLTGHRAIGTPAYMSPEALAGSQDLDTRTDVFSLGVVLYELLLGTKPDAPLKAERRVSIGGQQTRSQPIRPSTRLMKGDSTQLELLARRRNRSVAEIRKAMSGDLDWITMKAIADEREQRYDSVADLAADVERHLRFEPVLASPPSLRYRTSRFIRRHRVAVAAGTLVVLALIGGFIGTSIGLVRARIAEAEARLEATRAEAVAAFMTELFRVSDPGQARGSEVTARELLDRGAERIERELSAQPVLRTRLLATMEDSFRNLGLYDDATRLAEANLATQAEGRSSDDPELAAPLGRLGNLYRLQGRYDEARELLERSARLQRASLGDDETPSPALGETLANLASTHVFLGEIEMAERRYDDALAVLEAAHEFGEEGVGATLATALYHYGWFLNSAVRLDEAADVLRRAVALRHEVLGEDHFELANAVLLLATVERHRGRYEAAAAGMQRGLAIQQAVLEPDHPDIAQTYLDFGELRRAEGNYEDARVQIGRALELLRARLGERHPEVARAVGELAMTAYYAGDVGLAEARFREQLDLLGGADGQDRSTVARVLNNLGTVLSDTEAGRPEGELVLIEAVSIFDALEPPDTYWQALSRWSLADNLRYQERYQAAAIRYEEAIERLTGGEARRRDDNPDLDALVATYAEMLRKSGDEAGAAELEQRFDN